MSNLVHAIIPGVKIVAGENDDFSFQEDGYSSVNATIAPGTYFLTNDGSSDDLCKAFTDALADGYGTPSFAVSWQDQGTDTVSSVSITLSSNLATSVTWGGFDGYAFGFDGADLSSVTSESNVQNPLGLWRGDDGVSKMDTVTRGYGSQIINQKGDVYTHTRSTETWEDLSLAWEMIPESLANPIESSTYKKNKSIEYAWRNWRLGLPIKLYECSASPAGVITWVASSTLIGKYVLSEVNISGIDVNRNSTAEPYYYTDEIILKEWVD